MDLKNSRSVLTKRQRNIFEYWVSLCQDGTIPARRQINPVRLGAALAQTSLVQKENDEFRFRLTGSRVSGLFPCDQGKSLLDVIDGSIAEAGSASLELALETGRPVSGSCRVGARWHCWLRLPLVDDRGQLSLVLCIDESPAWLDSERSIQEDIMQERIVA